MNGDKPVEETMAEHAAREAEMEAELAKLGLPGLGDLSGAAFDEEAVWKDYPEIVRLAQTEPVDTLAETLAARIDAGADVNAASPFGETAIRATFDRSAFAAFRHLHARGADLPDWGWSPAHLSVALGELPEAGVDAMARDRHGRTPFLLACRVGNLEAAKALLPNTPAAGQRDVPDGDGAVFYAAKSGDAQTLAWILETGAEVDMRNRHGRTALLAAVEADHVEAARMLLEHGANLHLGENISLAMRDREAERTEEKSVLQKAAEIMTRSMPELADMPDTIVTPASAAHSAEMARLLAEYGAPIGDFDDDMVPAAMGTDQIAPTVVTPEMFGAQYAPRAGTANPERVDIPFWREQIRTGKSGFAAADDILGRARETQVCGGDPVWSFQRFGRTATRLDDGRRVLIAGEHEDHYDPDFCIYADVTVIAPGGEVDHYIYPADVFPPTDFHTATLLGDHILLIGNLGYQHLRHEGVTQVLRLNLADFSIEPVATTGDNPGWISRHEATLVGDGIEIGGGKVEPGYRDNTDRFVLDLSTRTWSRA